MFNEAEDPYLTWGVALREDTYTCRRECMLATNRLTCNRVLVRGTSLPPLVPTFMAPVHLFASVHAHADSRTFPLVLTRTSRVTSSTSSSLFFFFFFFLLLWFFSTLFSWFISFPTSFFLFSRVYKPFLFYDAESSSILFLSFLYLFATLFYFNSLFFFLNGLLSSTSFFPFATFPFTIRISSSLTSPTLSSFHPFFFLIFLFLVSLQLLFCFSPVPFTYWKICPFREWWRITLFLYNARTHRNTIAISIPILVSALSKGRSIFTVADSKEEKGEVARGNLLGAKITRRYKFTVKTESFRHVLVPPLSLSDVYRRGCSRPRQRARVK